MVTGGLVNIDGVEYYRIDGVEQMEPFLMTVVSDSDLWNFVSSTGALTAGRVDADHSLFPYETVDKLHRAAGITGPVTVIARTIDGQRRLWRPFGAERTASCTRSIAKSILGDRLVFEEHHHEWGLEFRASWAPSSTHGWVRTVEIVDVGGDVGGQGAELEVLDGLLDVMPAGVDARTEQALSNLVDSYKRSETGPWGTLAVYTLESLITDRAEPAASLTATTVWSSGFADATPDLDGRAVAAMVDGRPADPSRLVTGRPGAYLLRGAVTVPESGSVTWMMVADTGLAHPDVLAAGRAAADADAVRTVGDDVRAGSERLRVLLAGADAFQSTADGIADAHHLSNVLFNSMRGGVFPYGHQVPVPDLAEFVHARNREVSERCQTWLRAQGPWIDVVSLRDATLATGDDDLIRLVLEYLPLTFSRRHGDPSRPWNRFSINVRNADGGELLSYEGNWRDIFQNWEALLQSFPAYYAHVVAKFVNASTIDGYNPYRISRDGIDWEVPDPDDPWSHIGYWGDHQIIYLLRLLEAWEQHEPGAIREWLDRPVFVYADVPYGIADHEAMVADPKNTITFDERRAEAIARREQELGSDGRLVVGVDGALLRIGLLEKLLVPALAKLTSYVPGGGIWLNTQRPEWNDANNALAGPGLSMVTLYHLRRYLHFVSSQLDGVDAESVGLTNSVAAWFQGILEVFERISPATEPIDDRTRRSIVDALGAAGSEHRRRVGQGPDPTTLAVSIADVRDLCELAGDHLERSIRGAQRADGLYHSYNRVSFPTADTAHVDHLGPMLEGQVAVLSSGALDPEASVDLVDALFASGMYRADQDSFMLYPVVELPPFLERNIVPSEAVAAIPWLAGPLDDSLRRIFAIDLEGRLRFRPDIINTGVLAALLDQTTLPESDRDRITGLYEEVFHHSSFTGRSGSMYGYEGIGSVYWHMVAKLLLAVQETYWTAADQGAPDGVVERLADAYRRIRSGLGFGKQPGEYGAIPTDCYSHTPAHAGAQQPGMTGQVKEEVLTRFGELGLRATHGCVSLSPGLLPLSEIVPSGDRTGGRASASFTFCSVPMTLTRGEADGVTVVRDDGTREHRDGLALTPHHSQELFARGGGIARVDWTIGSQQATP
jgi:hypothetical protein